MVDEYNVPQDEIVTDIHCMNPNFLKYSIDKSLKNLGLETLDLLYL